MASADIFMRQALRLARQRQGFCAPNPSVGAIVVKDNKILGRGKHWAAGHPHAEVEALKNLSSEQTRGAAIYVTLEPCAHQGRTPPCTEQLLERGITQVFYGLQDPNPMVAGKGIQQLSRAGVSCQQILLPEIQAFYRSYVYWHQYKKPWVTFKLALSLNGKIALSGGKPAVITAGDQLTRYTHHQRKQADAILTTVKTVLADNPQLNVRLSSNTHKKPVYVLDTNLNFPTEAKLLSSALSLTLFHGEDVPLKRLLELQKRSIRCVKVAQKNGKLCLDTVLQKIGQEGKHDLWVEAGSECFQSFVKEKRVQRILLYVAPKWLESEALSAWTEGLDLRDLGAIRWRSMGDEVICEIVGRE